MLQNNLYGEKIFYFLNSTYRNNSRAVNCIIKLNDYFETNYDPNADCYQQIEDIVNRDMNLRVDNKEKRKISFYKKKSELKKFPFFTFEKTGKLIRNLNVNNLKPNDSLVVPDYNDEEWIANVMLYTLKDSLSFLKALIEGVSLKWKAKKGNRVGVSEYELMYLFAYLRKNNEEKSLDFLIDTIIEIRFSFKKYNKGKERDYVLKRINNDCYGVKSSTCRDYIDTFLRGLLTTKCFKTPRHCKDEDNKFAMKMLQLNYGFTKKFDFFINTSNENLKNLIEDNKLCEELYKEFNVYEAYEMEDKEINEKINHNPTIIKLDEKNFLENNDISWYEFDHYCSVFMMQNIYKNDANYLKYIKSLAIKTENGKPYNGSKPGVADSYAVMNDIILTVESAKLYESFTQCNKEYIPITSHINQLSNTHSKNGVCILVVPLVSQGLASQFIEHNYANPIRKQYDKNYLVPLNKYEYHDFIQHVNTNEDVKSFYDYLDEIVWDSKNDTVATFSEIVKIYLNKHKKENKNNDKTDS